MACLPMTNYSLFDCFIENLSQNKDRQALVFDDGQEKRTLSYQELLDMSKQISRVLSKFLRCKREMVGMCIRMDQSMPAVLLSVVMSDAAFYNFDADSVEFTCQVLQEMNIRIIIVTKEYVQRHNELIQKLGGQVTSFALPCLQQYVLVDLTGIRSRRHHDNLAYCITTSGTTGSPKVVQVLYDCIQPNICHLRDIYSLTPDDLVLLSSPLTFDPFIVEMFTTFSVGACLLIVPPTVKMMPSTLLDVIYLRNSVTVMQATPTLLTRFNPSSLKQTLLGDNSALRVLSLGGEKFPACTWLEKVRSLQNRTQFFNLYGTTEVSCWATCYKVTDEDLRSGNNIPLGEPLQDTVIQVIGKSDKEVSSGTGELYIGGTIRQCIVGQEDETGYDPTSLKLRSTGDIVRKDEDGRIFYLGREDLQVKRNGKRVNLEEINLLCMSDMPDGQITEEIKRHLKDRLPAHCVPDEVVVLPNIPMTRHGKIDLKQLQSVYETRNMDTSPYCASSVLERKWKEVLGSQVDIQENTNFILAGGDSLKAIYLHNDLENILNIQVPNLLDRILHKTFIEVKTYLTEFHNKIVSRPDGNNLEQKHMYLAEDSGNTTGSSQSKLRSKRKMEEPDSSSIKPTKTQRKNSKNEKCSIGILATSKILLNSNMSSLVEPVRVSDNMGNIKQYLMSISRGNRIQNTVVGAKEMVDGNVIASSPENSIDGEGWKHEVVNYMRVREALQLDSIKIDLEEQWKHDTRRCVDASPLIAVSRTGDHTVFIGSHSYTFCAISMTTGKCLWEVALRDRIESSACLSLCGNFVIVGCYHGHVYVLHAYTGDIWWQHQLSGIVACSPTVDRMTGTVYVGSHGQVMLALDIQSRRVVWENELLTGAITSPVVCYKPHCVYVATSLRGTIYSLCAQSGVVLWKYVCKKFVFSSPSVTHLGVVVGCADNCLYHISHKGHLLWTFPTEECIYSIPSVFSRNTYVCKGRTQEGGAETTNINHSTTDEEIKPEQREITPAVTGFVINKCDDVSKTNDTMSVYTHGQREITPKVDAGSVTTNNNSNNVSTQNISEKQSKITSLSPGTDHIHNEPVKQQSDLKEQRERTHTTSGLSPTVHEPAVKESSILNEQRARTSITMDVCRTIHEATNESIVVGSNDSCVYCLSSCGCLIWKVKVDSRVYATPFQCELLVDISEAVVDTSTELAEVNAQVESNKMEKSKNNNSEILEIKNACSNAQRNECENKKCGTGKSVRLTEMGITSVCKKSLSYAQTSESCSEIRSVSKRMIYTASSMNKKLIQNAGQPCTTNYNETADCHGNSRNMFRLPVVVFASVKGLLYIVDVEKGKILSEHRLTEGKIEEIFSSPVLHENTLVIGCRDNFVYCYKIYAKLT